MFSRTARRVWQDALKCSLRAVFQRRDCFGMSQQTFGGHHDERLAPGADGLTPQAMKILSGSRWINDLHIIFGAEMQKAFKTGARVFGPLAFEAMRQKQNDAAESFPF